MDKRTISSARKLDRENARDRALDLSVGRELERKDAEIERLRAALTKIAKMEPSEIAPETFPGLVHGSALLFANSQRIAREALRAVEQSAQGEAK